MKPVPTDRRCGGPTPALLRTGVRVFAGLFFAATGAAKLPVLDGVARVVGSVSGVGGTMAVAGAAAVTGVEIWVGGLLLTGTRARMGAGIGVGCMVAFAAAIGSLLLRGVELDCHCFGVLGVRIPLAGELALDLLLAFLLWRLRRSLPPETDPVNWLRIGVPGAVALLIPALAALDTGPRESISDGRAILRQCGWEGGRAAPRLLLLLDYRELQCAICFDDFIALCDSLQLREGALRESVLTLLRSDTAGGVGAGDLLRWAKETGIVGRPVVLDAEAYDGLASGSNEALLLRPDGTTVLRAELPLGVERRSHLLALLGGE